jgi:hypothetical protein
MVWHYTFKASASEINKKVALGRVTRKNHGSYDYPWMHVWYPQVLVL